MRPPRRRRTLIVFVVAALVLTWTAGARRLLVAQELAEEFRLKAAFLYRFPQFVEWPARVVNGRKSIDLCVFGSTPVGVALRELVDGETIDGRTLAVRYVEPAAAIEQCHLVFLPDGVDHRRVLRNLATLPVLTVGDAAQFLDDGGIIRLRTVENRLRFEIDAAAADRAGLRLSAQLLRLALRVRGVPS